jgi:hypothetical protein
MKPHGFLGVFLLFARVLGQDVSDAGTVRAILDTNGMAARSLDEVAVIEQGEVVRLDLTNEDFSSPGLAVLPASIGGLTSCKVLLLNDNDLRNLPEEIGAMKALQKLEVRNNRLEALPASIGTLTNLTEIDLRNNEITTLPTEIGKLDKVWKLQLWGNRLETLPASIDGMSSLRELYLKGNDIGTLPMSITTVKLQYLDWQENRLCDLPPKLDAWMTKWDDKYESWQKCWEKEK